MCIVKERREIMSKFEMLGYFFVFISINLTISDINTTSKVAKEHTNVKAS